MQAFDSRFSFPAGACLFLLYVTPLLEEEGNISREALVA